MIIQIDTREKPKAIERLIEQFDARGVKHISSKLYVGDYMNLDNPKVIIDRKQNLSELCVNVCQAHKRFAAELTRAKEAGIHMIILVEHGEGIHCLEDVRAWENPRLAVSPMAVSGVRLFKILSAMEKSARYDVSFAFCDKSETGNRIMELLRG